MWPPASLVRSERAVLSHHGALAVAAVDAGATRDDAGVDGAMEVLKGLNVATSCCSGNISDGEDLLRSRFTMLSDGAETLPTDKLPELLELIYDHAFTEDECDVYVSRTASFAFHKLEKSRSGDLAPKKARLTWEEVEYIVDLCEKRYPLLAPAANGGGAFGVTSC